MEVYSKGTIIEARLRVHGEDRFSNLKNKHCKQITKEEFEVLT